MPYLGKLKVGDRVTRVLAGLPMLGIVREVQETFIVWDALNFAGGWTFDIDTGMEIDEDLGWGPKYGHTGSFIRLED